MKYGQFERKKSETGTAGRIEMTGKNLLIRATTEPYRFIKTPNVRCGDG